MEAQSQPAGLRALLGPVWIWTEGTTPPAPCPQGLHILYYLHKSYAVTTILSFIPPKSFWRQSRAPLPTGPTLVQALACLCRQIEQHLPPTTHLV